MLSSLFKLIIVIIVISIGYLGNLKLLFLTSSIYLFFQATLFLISHKAFESFIDFFINYSSNVKFKMNRWSIIIVSYVVSVHIFLKGIKMTSSEKLNLFQIIIVCVLIIYSISLDIVFSKIENIVLKYVVALLSFIMLVSGLFWFCVYSAL